MRCTRGSVVGGESGNRSGKIIVIGEYDLPLACSTPPFPLPMGMRVLRKTTPRKCKNSPFPTWCLTLRAVRHRERYRVWGYEHMRA